MDTMAMVFIVDLALKNRRWDEDFDPKPPGRIRRILNALANRLADRRRAQIGSEKKCTAEPCGHAVQF